MFLRFAADLFHSGEGVVMSLRGRRPVIKVDPERLFALSAQLKATGIELLELMTRLQQVVTQMDWQSSIQVGMDQYLVQVYNNARALGTAVEGMSYWVEVKATGFAEADGQSHLVQQRFLQEYNGYGRAGWLAPLSELKRQIVNMGFGNDVSGALRSVSMVALSTVAITGVAQIYPGVGMQYQQVIQHYHDFQQIRSDGRGNGFIPGVDGRAFVNQYGPTMDQYGRQYGRQYGEQYGATVGGYFGGPAGEEAGRFLGGELGERAGVRASFGTQVLITQGVGALNPDTWNGVWNPDSIANDSVQILNKGIDTYIARTNDPLMRAQAEFAKDAIPVVVEGAQDLGGAVSDGFKRATGGFKW
jgi:hypothetical protein